MRRRTVVSAGVPLAVYEQGNPAGPTVLLVHGYPDTHWVWDDVAAALAADGHHVVRYDVRGAGASGAAKGVRGYRLPQLADDLFAVADAVSPHRAVHLAAHDWGSIQAWEAVTDPRAAGRIASYTSLSGPCLDHVGHWARRRLARPTPRHLGQLLTQAAHSWYIGVFHLPLLAPAVWRLGLAARWGYVLASTEGVIPRTSHPQPTLATDAVHGIALYRANMLPHLLRPRQRPTAVPVQLITLVRDRYVSPALGDDLDRWVPHLWRRTLTAGHWSALLEKGPTVAQMIKEIAAHADGAPASPALERAAVSSRERAAGPRRPQRPRLRWGRGRGPGLERAAFAGKLAVVTGGGSGIGRATALAFAEHGAAVVVCDLDLATAERTVELARLLGAPAAHAHRVDVADSAAVDTFAREVAAAHGVPDIVVNNAGVGHGGTFLQTTEKEWQHILEVNLGGVVHGCRAFATLMVERGEGGHIVNVSSAAAYLPSKVLAAYATSKAAVYMLSDCLRAELAPAGIGVSTICPGLVNTNITRTSTFSGRSADGLDATRDRFAALYARRNFPPEKVAWQILRAVRENRAVVPVTVEARAGRVLSRLSPALTRVAARIDID
ncbi:SDR family oxidoreductase [Protofrankia coriariae]|uniref:Short-chain dehydrogenase n=1 Tax=Protofrankia coriariae TaxID=1562887 RepID=A0ABR5F166_9ACTN|nr:SDR family oxidoreductase [Protofrankia coriariae]KLL10383.1 short-chain dehydrogenase [Protofrankia coriariae]